MKKSASRSAPRMGAQRGKRKIAIVGAGQAGLQLGMSLLPHRDYEVTLYSDRAAREIASGPLMATAIMFQGKRDIERRLGLDFWSEEGVQVRGIEMEVRDHTGKLGMAFDAPFLDGPGMALDFRLKFPAWMNEFEKRGGKLRIQKTGIDKLEQLAASHDLTVVAAGKGPLSQLFRRNPDRSPPYSEPMRQIVAVIVDRDLNLSNMAISIVPGGAEIVLLPILAGNGKRSTAILVFAQKDSAFMDQYVAVNNGGDALKMALSCACTYCPKFSQALAGAKLSDQVSYLRGGFTPVVRDPVGQLPSRAVVMGVSDCLTLVDPICGNGLNNAVVMANILNRRILESNGAGFDRAWMNQAFDEFWDYGKKVYVFMRALLEQPAYFSDALGPASHNQSLASDIINGYPDPVSFAGWMADEKTAREHINMRIQGRELAA